MKDPPCGGSQGSEKKQATLLHRMCALKEDGRQKNWKLSRYWQDVGNLRNTYEAHDIIAEADKDIRTYKHPIYMRGVMNFEIFWKWALRCKRGYDESRPNGVLLE